MLRTPRPVPYLSYVHDVYHVEKEKVILDSKLLSPGIVLPGFVLCLFLIMLLKMPKP